MLTRWRIDPWNDDDTDHLPDDPRTFWTRWGALRWAHRHYRHAVIFPVGDGSDKRGGLLRWGTWIKTPTSG